MKIDVTVSVNHSPLFVASAERVKIGPLNDTYELTVNDVPFGDIQSCGACGIPVLVQRIVRYVLSDDGMLRQKADA